MSTPGGLGPRLGAAVTLVGVGTLLVLVSSSGLASVVPGHAGLSSAPAAFVPRATEVPLVAVASGSHRPAPLGPSLGPSLSPSRPAAGDPAGPYVLSTLVLANGTVIPGNFVSPSPLELGAMLYDPARGEVFVASPEGAHGHLAVFSDTTDTIVGMVTVGTDPAWMAYDPARGEVFVSDLGGNAVSVVNDTTDAVVATVPAPSPTGIAYDAADGDVYVTGYLGPTVSIIDDASNRVVGTIPLPSCCNGTGVAYDPAKGALFVAVADRGVVYVVSTSSRNVVARVPVGSYPVALTYDPAAGEVVVANQQSDNLSIINDTTDTVVATVAIGTQPTAVTYDGRTDQLFIAESATNDLAVINGSSSELTGIIAVGTGPDGVAYDPAHREVFVADEGSGDVSVVSDTSDQVVATEPVTYAPDGLVYDPAQNELFVSDYYESCVQVISLSNDTIVATVPVGASPRGMAYDPRTGEVFVADWGSSQVSVISDSTNTVVTTVGLPTGSYPSDATYDPGADDVFVADQDGNDTSVISDATDTVVATVPVGGDPTTLTYDAGTSEIFVANAGTSNVSVIAGATGLVVATVAVPSSVFDLAYDAGLGQLFATGLGVVSVISDATDAVVATVPVGASPDGIAYDPATGELFVANQQSGNVSAILDATDTVAATVRVGAYPGAEAFDAGNGLVYVANFLQGTISMLANGFANPVVFTESGLPSGTAWSVTLNGTRAGSQGPAIGFLVANGSYPFSVANSISGDRGFVPSPATGSITASGNSPTVGVTFSSYQLYNLTFDERGLPNATNWSLDVDGNAYRSNLSAIAVPEEDGTYSFVLGPVPGYAVNPRSGSVTVNGEPVSISVNFTVATYSVSATASGLPPSRGWQLFLGSDGPGAPPFQVLHCSRRCDGRPFSVGGVANGTVPYVVSGPAGYRLVGQPEVGNLTVSGANVSLALRFAPGATVKVGFSESGLPRGTRWCVQFVWTDCSTGASMKTGSPWPLSQLNLSPGAYPYTVLPVRGREISAKVGPTAIPLSGTLDVGRSETVALTYVWPYPVTFIESGLPSGGSWSVTVNGLTGTNATGGPIVFQLPNGSHAYTVGAESGYAVSGSPRVAKVHGAPLSVAITFSKHEAPTAAVPLPAWVAAPAPASGALVFVGRGRPHRCPPVGDRGL